MNIFKSTKNAFNNLSLNVINLVLTLTTLIYLVSIYGFDHLNKELIINFIIGAGFTLFILTLVISIIALVLLISFKIIATKILSNIEILSDYFPQNKNSNEEKAQE